MKLTSNKKNVIIEIEQMNWTIRFVQFLPGSQEQSKIPNLIVLIENWFEPDKKGKSF